MKNDRVVTFDCSLKHVSKHLVEKGCCLINMCYSSAGFNGQRMKEADGVN